jgi:hypothetical protein
VKRIVLGPLTALIASLCSACLTTTAGSPDDNPPLSAAPPAVDYVDWRRRAVQWWGPIDCRREAVDWRSDAQTGDARVWQVLRMG